MEKTHGNTLQLPEIAAALLFTARTHRRMGTNLKPYQVFKTVYDGMGGMWTVGEREDSIALTYTKNKNLYDSGMTELARWEPQYTEAVRKRKMMDDETLGFSEVEKEQAESEIEIIEDRIRNARSLMSEYAEKTYLFPMSEPLEVEVALND